MDSVVSELFPRAFKVDVSVVAHRFSGEGGLAGFQFRLF